MGELADDMMFDVAVEVVLTLGCLCYFIFEIGDIRELVYSFEHGGDATVFADDDDGHRHGTSFRHKFCSRFKAWIYSGNAVDMILWVLLLTMLGVHGARTILQHEALHDIDLDRDHLELRFISRIYDTEILGFGVALFIAWCQLVKFLRMAPDIGPNSVALFTALMNPQVWMFLGLFGFVTLALAIMIYVAFGGGLDDYPQFSNSYMSAVQAMLSSDISLEKMQGVHKVFGTIIWLLVTVIFSQFVTSTFLSVISDSYNKSVGDSEAQWDKLRHLPQRNIRDR